MNCDQAFECMTDPSGRQESALLEHLAACSRCREMHEILSPAMHWLAVSAREMPKSPCDGRSPLLTTEALQLAEQVALSLRRQQRQRTGWWPSVAMVILVGCTAMAASLLPVNQEDTGHFASSAEPALLASCTWIGPSFRTTHGSKSPREIILSCINCHVPDVSTHN